MTEIVDTDALEKELSADEGRKARGYRCPAGYWTIGIGHNTEGKDLSDRAIRVIFEDDVADAIAGLDSIWIGWRALSEKRKRALINLSFQLGVPRFLGFKKFWAALEQYDFEAAAHELEDSLWYRQTQLGRVHRVVNQIRYG